MENVTLVGTANTCEIFGSYLHIPHPTPACHAYPVVWVFNQLIKHGKDLNPCIASFSHGPVSYSPIQPWHTDPVHPVLGIYEYIKCDGAHCRWQNEPIRVIEGNPHGIRAHSSDCYGIY